MRDRPISDMTMISWNCRGVGRAHDLVIPRLRELWKDHAPDVLFLMETKNGRDSLVDLQEWLGFDRIITVNPIGYSGGLALFWKNSVRLDFKFVDKNVVDFHVQSSIGSFFVSCVYGHPVYKERPRVWERLTRIGINRKIPWCVMGDFNAIRHNGEKLEGPRRSEAHFQPFNDMIQASELAELHSFGNEFTWGGRRGDVWIQCKLDRAFGNKNWFSLFPQSSQTFLEKRGSDHRPVLVKLLAGEAQHIGRFRYDSRFLNNAHAKGEIKKAWMSSHWSEPSSVSERIHKVRRGLSKWKKSQNLNARDKLIHCQVELEKEQSEASPSTQRLAYLNRLLVMAYKEEEDFWRQKCRDKWAIRGDRNTKFYHASVKANRARKRILKLVDDQGISHFSESAKGEVASAYFRELFKSSNPDSFLQFFEGFSPSVTPTMNELLLKDVSIAEVREAVFAINAASAPGPDGMTGMFFQKNWDIVGIQVTEEVQRFFNEGTLPKDWNFTHLCLIPKIIDPQRMVDLRPISLCSVLYKIISKIMVWRLKPLLPDIVSPTQSAFVEERLISDNILIAHEMIHSLRTNDKISDKFMAIKSDMSKAYDRVEWSYLKALMQAMGFHGVWIDRVMECVSSVTYAVLINDQSYGNIEPGRGLRQGDPLSPFLFVLCTEGLIHLIKKAEKDGRLEGIQFDEKGPMIHHLLFADDCLFVCKASDDQAAVLMEILDRYGRATGQRLNLEKSAITFGKKVPVEKQTSIKRITGIEKEGGTGNYLGLPECFSGSKTEMLAYIYDRLKDRLSGYFARLLSQGGKEVLLKAVAMAMPVYAMSCFKLTKISCENLTQAMASFWWDSLEHKRKIHWLSWEKLCLSKQQGGLAFKDIQTFNQALLARQAWRLLDQPESLFARVYKSRYFPDGDFLNAKMGARPSYGWRSIQFGKELLSRGLRKQIGNGNSVSVWMDSWIVGEIMRRPLMKNIIVDLELKVSHLINGETRTWKRSVLEELFFPDDIDSILKMKPVVDDEDYWTWCHNRNGVYSVKSGYWMMNNEKHSGLIQEASLFPSLNPLKEAVWKVKTAPKIRIFMWRAVSNAIPVGELMIKRGMKLDPCCQLCGFEGESVNHLIFTCPLARQVWALSLIPLPENGFDMDSFYSNLHFLLTGLNDTNSTKEARRRFPWFIWHLWKNRNVFWFEGRRFNAFEIVQKIMHEADSWFLAVELEESRLEEEKRVEQSVILKWEPPQVSWLKCNIGVNWRKEIALGGAAWVLRDSEGKVLMHSRRAFTGLNNLNELKFQVLMWAIESMVSHRLNRVIFAIDDDVIVGAVSRPKAWPSFKGMSAVILFELRKIERWSFLKEVKFRNRGAFLIAQSVTRDLRLQSYVAAGYPFWLQDVFENEKRLASL